MTPRERDQLIDDLLDGVIAEADLVRLEAEFQVDPAARRAYCQRARLHHHLQLAAEEVPAAGAAPGPGGFDLALARWRWAGVGGAAAALVLATLAGWLAGRGGDSAETNRVAAAGGEGAATGGAGEATPPAARSEPVAAGFGVLAEQSDAVWGGASPAPGRGDLLPPGELHLVSGIAQLELFSGVTVVVSGEARLDVLSAMELAVHQGKVRAHVPGPAEGFKIRTGGGEVVDLGTEFGLDVTPAGTEIHVLDGKVDWHPTREAARQINQGEALRWTGTGSGGGAATDLPTDPARFPGAADLEALAADRRNEGYRRWLDSSAELARDPRLLAYFPMNPADPGWTRRLPDASGQDRDGTVVRAARAPDRWGRPGGLDFSPTGSRVRMRVPGRHGSLTLLCWAKIDSLDRWYNSLFLTDGHELHEPHWQIMDDGRLFFSVKAHDTAPHKHIFYSPPFWTHAMSGQWIQIATVYDVGRERVTHFINGEAISSEAVPPGMLVEQVSIGAASVGNWSEPYRSDPHFAVRNLNGTIDEFALFGAALGADEIAELYRAGRP